MKLLKIVTLILSLSSFMIHADELKVGAKIKLELSSNPTTGYSWHLQTELPKDAIIKIIGSGYEPLKNVSAQLVGSGGTQFWNIKAKKQGTIRLIFEKRRPWEKNIEPVDVKTIDITVK